MNVNAAQLTATLYKPYSVPDFHELKEKVAAKGININPAAFTIITKPLQERKASPLVTVLQRENVAIKCWQQIPDLTMQTKIDATNHPDLFEALKSILKKDRNNIEQAIKQRPQDEETEKILDFLYFLDQLIEKHFSQKISYQDLGSIAVLWVCAMSNKFRINAKDFLTEWFNNAEQNPDQLVQCLHGNQSLNNKNNKNDKSFHSGFWFHKTTGIFLFHVHPKAGIPIRAFNRNEGFSIQTAAGVKIVKHINLAGVGTNKNLPFDYTTKADAYTSLMHDIQHAIDNGFIDPVMDKYDEKTREIKLFELNNRTFKAATLRNAIDELSGIVRNLVELGRFACSHDYEAPLDNLKEHTALQENDITEFILYYKQYEDHINKAFPIDPPTTEEAKIDQKKSKKYLKDMTTFHYEGKLIQQLTNISNANSLNLYPEEDPNNLLKTTDKIIWFFNVAQAAVQALDPLAEIYDSANLPQ